MADSGLQALRPGPETLAGTAIPFRFEVTWHSLTRTFSPTSETAAIFRPPRRVPVGDVDAKEWEMVLPRMRRPASLAPSKSLELAPSAPPVSNIPAPNFASATDRASRRWIFPAAVALLVPMAWAAFRWAEQHSISAVEPASTTLPAKDMGGTGWMSEWASDSTGSARGRQLSLYRPSMGMSNYRLEFSGRIERKSLGWVFRAVDSKNYYVGKLETFSPGLAVTHFAVIRGIEGPHIQRIFPIATGVATTLKVRLDASGPRFTIYVQNQAVEDWQDSRLTQGGVGFLNEREESGQVGSVQISFPKGGRQ